MAINLGTNATTGAGEIKNGALVGISVDTAGVASTVLPLVVPNGTGVGHAVALGQVLPTAAISNFRAYQSTGQSISANTWTAIIFQTKVFDDLVEYDVATGKFTAKVDGTYMFKVGIKGSQTSATNRLIMIYLNGSLYQYIFENPSFTGAIAIFAGTTPIKLNAGDYAQAYYYTGIAETLTAGQTFTYFGGYRIK